MCDSLFSTNQLYTLINKHKLVQVTGLEPVRYKTHAPQACLSANSSIPAKYKLLFNNNSFSPKIQVSFIKYLTSIKENNKLEMQYLLVISLNIPNLKNVHSKDFL